MVSHLRFRKIAYALKLAQRWYGFQVPKGIIFLDLLEARLQLNFMWYSIQYTTTPVMET